MKTFRDELETAQIDQSLRLAKSDLALHQLALTPFDTGIGICHESKSKDGALGALMHSQSLSPEYNNRQISQSMHRSHSLQSLQSLHALRSLHSLHSFDDRPSSSALMILQVLEKDSQHNTMTLAADRNSAASGATTDTNVRPMDRNKISSVV